MDRNVTLAGPENVSARGDEDSIHGLQHLSTGSVIESLFSARAHDVPDLRVQLRACVTLGAQNLALEV
jgi:hypothetical protein